MCSYDNICINPAILYIFLTARRKGVMKRFSFFLFLLFILMLPSRVFSQKTLTFTTADNQEHPRSIAMNAVVTEAFRRMGIKIRIIAMPSKRSLINANKGIEDGNLLRTKGITARYPNLLMVPEKLSINQIVAFSKNRNIRVDGWKSLNSYHVVCVNGWRNCERELPAPKQKTIVKNDKLLFTLLEKNRADVGIFGRNTGMATLKKLGITDIIPLEPPIIVSDLFLYIHKKHESLIPDISSTLRQMKL